MAFSRFWRKAAVVLWTIVVAFTLTSKTALAHGNVLKKRFSSGGKQFFLVEKRNGNGIVTEQVLMSDDRAVIASDPKGRGYLKSWELITPNRRVTLHEPFKGRFMRMDIAEQAPGVTLKMKFHLLSNGKYRLLSVVPKARRTQFLRADANDFIVGCRNNEEPLNALAAQVSEMFAANDDDHIKDVIANEIMKDGSCKRGSFGDPETNRNLLNGIQAVFKSDPTWNQAHAANLKNATGDQRSVGSQGMYLQCLRYHHMDGIANRIGSAPANYYIESQNSSWKWKISCVDNGDIEKSGGSQGKAAAAVKSLGAASPQLVTYGSYEYNGHSPPTIKFYNPGSPQTAKDYARTFFHEMLHYADVPDGNVLDTIVACCAPEGTSNPNSPDCKRLDQMVLLQMRAQQSENNVSEALGDDYPNFVAAIRNAMGSESGDRILNDFYGDVGKIYRDLEGQGCSFGDKSKVTSECETKFKSRLQSAIDNSFGPESQNTCAREAAEQTDVETGKLNCTYLKEYLAQIYGLPSRLGGMCKKVAEKANERSFSSLGWLAYIPSARAHEFDQGALMCELGSGAETVAWQTAASSSYNATINATIATVPLLSSDLGQSKESTAASSNSETPLGGGTSGKSTCLGRSDALINFENCKQDAPSGSRFTEPSAWNITIQHASTGGGGESAGNGEYRKSRRCFK